MGNIKTKKMVASALFAALIFIATFFISIKLPHGYINVGDGFVLLSGCILGPVYGALAAAIGSALADIIGGYFLYAPATFIIKALMAVGTYYIYASIKKNSKFIATFVSGIVGEVIMIALYFVFEAFVIGFAAAVINIYANSLQAGASFVIYILFMNILSRKKFLDFNA